MGEHPPIDAGRLLATFLELCRTYSPSGTESACAALCADALRSAGCAVRFDDSAATTGSDTGNLIAVLQGTTPGTLVLCAHLDCVEPCDGVEPIIEDGIITSASQTVLGADDKAGLSAAIECVAVMAASSKPRPTLKCVFTVQEEVGLRGAKALDPSVVSGDVCLVLDAEGEPGGIVIAAPTHITFTAEFTGRAAHAGVSPEQGVSAIAMAADAVCRLPSGRVDELSTANVGTIEGGTATNVIAGWARLTGECRSIDRVRAEALQGTMDQIIRSAAREAGGEVELLWTVEYEGFTFAETEGPVELVRAACIDVGIPPRFFATGGGSDANVIAALGVPAVALSCGMKGVHGTAESLAVSDLERLTELCVAVAARMARED
ncbi:MAG: M20/M25/M40 family metallo-hydrolase [Coriobacteriia bacterium]|nr:M20/M25/M40 family metallo-hydrolase [Coriobacteriia bacterium]